MPPKPTTAKTLPAWQVTNLIEAARRQLWFGTPQDVIREGIEALVDYAMYGEETCKFGSPSESIAAHRGAIQPVVDKVMTRALIAGAR